MVPTTQKPLLMYKPSTCISIHIVSFVFLWESSVRPEFSEQHQLGSFLCIKDVVEFWRAAIHFRDQGYAKGASPVGAEIFLRVRFSPNAVILPVLYVSRSLPAFVRRIDKLLICSDFNEIRMLLTIYHKCSLFLLINFITKIKTNGQGIWTLDQWFIKLDLTRNHCSQNLKKPVKEPILNHRFFEKFQTPETDRYFILKISQKTRTRGA